MASARLVVLLVLLPLPLVAQRPGGQGTRAQLWSIDYPSVRMVFPNEESVDSSKAQLIRYSIQNQPALPALPLDETEPRLTVSLVVSARPGAKAHSVANLGTIVLPLAALDWPLAELNRALRHELAHIRLWRFLGTEGVPKWLSEGYAEWATGGMGCRGDTRVRIAVAIHTMSFRETFQLAGLGSRVGTRVAYDLYATVIEYIDTQAAGLKGTLRQIAARGVAGGIQAALGLSQAELELRWQAFLRDRYGVLRETDGCTWLFPGDGEYR